MENLSVSDPLMLKQLELENYEVPRNPLVCLLVSFFLCPKGRFSIFGSPGAFAKSRCLAKRTTQKNTGSQLVDSEFFAL